jgi:D-arginine dehydrogenase
MEDGVLVIGAGIAGAGLAHALAPHRPVQVLERESAPGYHATGRSAAEFAHRFHSDAFSRLAAASHAFLAAPPDGFTEVPLLRRRGNLLIADAAKADHLHRIYLEESRSMPGLERLDVDGALERVPFLDPAWVAAAFHDPDCWDIEVGNLLEGFVSGARRAGAAFAFDVRITGAHRSGDRWVVETSDGEYRAGTVVDAAGAWADPVAELFGAGPLGLVPHRRTAIHVDVPGIELDALPEVNEIDELFYFKPDAGRLLVSPADETPCAPQDAAPEELDVAWAAHYLTECTTLAVERVPHAWAGLRTFAPDRRPVVGADPRAPGFFWLAGQGGAGIQTAPALSALGAALLTGAPLPDTLREAGVDPADFAPDRLL